MWASQDVQVSVEIKEQLEENKQESVLSNPSESNLHAELNLDNL